MAKQLTIFIENKPGKLESVTEHLLNSGIDIRAFTIQDRGDYGLLKLIVDKPREAYLALADLGFACALKDILAVSVDDKPGNLHKLATAMAKANINVKDAYGFVLQPHQNGICCLEIENLKHTRAAEVVSEAGFTVLEDAELYNL